jgi:hypothetical protein
MSTRNCHQNSAVREQLISALLPDVTAPRPAPQPVPMPSLPAPTPPQLDDPDRVLLSTGRLDRSGRLHERAVLCALGWGPGQELTLHNIDDMIVIKVVAGGDHRIDDRGGLALPAAVRRMCGITIGPPVVLVADVPEQTLLVHPARTITRLLAMHYQTLIGIPDAR